VTNRPRALIVDDYPGARYRRMRILLDAGFDVAEESLGREAVRRIASERFDILIVDMHLPDIGGLDVCRQVRGASQTSLLPILAVSAVSDSEDAERVSREAGASAFVSDESDQETFLNAVRGALAGRGIPRTHGSAD
jgi:CheY-like chemotaxis protein